LEGLRGFSDFVHFYRLARMGWPFVDYWVEYPPLFPFISRFLYLINPGEQHVYDYLLAMVFSLAGAVNIWAFRELAYTVASGDDVQPRVWMYFLITLIFPYNWWYFDTLVVFTMLAGLLWLIQGKDLRASIILALGTLTKFFPLLVLPLVWRIRSYQRAFLVSVLVMGIGGIVMGGLYMVSPEMTLASLRSQFSKGSWETVWALVDGNLHTGSFGAMIERYDPDRATLPRGYPHRIHPGLTLIPFAVLGGWILYRGRVTKPASAVALLGLIWCLFLFWSPGYSPQWVLYILPLVLLVIPFPRAALITLILVLINLLEWPGFLARGYNWGLWLTVPVRTLVLIDLMAEFRRCLG
jgi:hypothetical protein